MSNYAKRETETLREWADRVNGKPNPNRAHCYFDGAVIEQGEGFAVCLPEAGIMPRYACPTCRRKLNTLERYHYNATHRDAEAAPLGTPKKGDVEATTIGLEIEEVHYSSPSFFTFKILIERCFNVVAEDDCTVDAEFPTDKMSGANKASKMLKKLQKYGFLTFLDNDRVGAHIHVYCNCIPIVRNWYNTLFVPLCEYIQGHSTEWIIEKFGRAFGSYRYPIDHNTGATNHSNFVNTEHGHTLEFRLPRIHTAEQYLKVVYFWRLAVATLNATEWIEDNGNNRAERKEQAEAVAKSIVEIAKKHFGA